MSGFIQGEDRSQATLFPERLDAEDSAVRVIDVFIDELDLSGLGFKTLAGKRLLIAERAVKRARLSGVDDPNIYYTEAVILVLRNEKKAALAKLRDSYEHGFRDYWRLVIDDRVSSIPRR
jgi:hypothetical protein